MSGKGKSDKGESEFRSLSVKVSAGTWIYSEEDIRKPFLIINCGLDDVRKPQANSISTTKYTWYSWLPKSIWEQFRRVANVYFLLISILMVILKSTHINYTLN